MRLRKLINKTFKDEKEKPNFRYAVVESTEALLNVRTTTAFCSILHARSIEKSSHLSNKHGLSENVSPEDIIGIQLSRCAILLDGHMNFKKSKTKRQLRPPRKHKNERIRC